MKKTISKFKLPKMTILVLMILLLSGIVFAERETTSWSFLKDKIWNTGDGVTVKTWHGLLDKITDLEENGGGGKFVDGLSSTDAVFMDGNVGIGTDNPTAKLEVHGSIWAHSSIGASRSDDSGNIYLGLNEGSNKSYKYGNPNIIRYGGSGLGANSLAFEAAGNVETMRIQNGNVGIGTDSPTAKLSIGGGEENETRLNFPASDNSERFKIKSDLDPYVRLDLLKFGSLNYDNQLVLKGDGNVGIGTDGPTAKLDVVGDIAIDNTVALSGVYSWSTNITYTSNTWFDILGTGIYTGLPSGNFMCGIQNFTSAQKGGIIYNSYITFPLSFNERTNGTNNYLIPFSNGFHAMNGRTIELLFQAVSGSRYPKIRMRVNGESATNVPINIKCLKLF